MRRLLPTVRSRLVASVGLILMLVFLWLATLDGWDKTYNSLYRIMLYAGFVLLPIARFMHEYKDQPDDPQDAASQRLIRRLIVLKRIAFLGLLPLCMVAMLCGFIFPLARPSRIDVEAFSVLALFLGMAIQGYVVLRYDKLLKTGHS